MEHFFIPDTQCRPEHTFEHLTGAGNYIASKQPDKIIHAGDHWDMNSLCYYDKGKRRSHGVRYEADIQAGKDGMEALMRPIINLQAKQKRSKKPIYRPDQHFLLGNHEQRIESYCEANPELTGKLGYHDFELDSWGWKVHGFREVVVLDGVHYSHYFYNPVTSKPYGGVAHSRLKNIGFSFTQGHKQGKDQAERYLCNGQVHRGLIAGSFYQHNEHYLGPQGNDHWRGCIYKHEVHNGNYDIMELSLRYLIEEWT